VRIVRLRRTLFNDLFRIEMPSSGRNTKTAKSYFFVASTKLCSVVPPTEAAKTSSFQRVTSAVLRLSRHRVTSAPRQKRSDEHRNRGKSSSTGYAPVTAPP
jgi:hypothetical protein